MARFIFLALLAACAGKTPSPVAGNGPEAPNEKVLKFEGPLAVEMLPQHAIEVSGGDVFVWGYLEDVCDKLTKDGAFSEAENIARTELTKFVDVAVQQLDLQFQAVGQESTSSAESQAIMQKVLENVAKKMGKSERAYQKVEREGSTYERFFVRYKLSKGNVEDAFTAGVGERPLRAEVVRRVIASFDPDQAR
jgi:hypothetical protein